MSGREQGKERSHKFENEMNSAHKKVPQPYSPPKCYSYFTENVADCQVIVLLAAGNDKQSLLLSSLQYPSPTRVVTLLH